MGAGRIEQKEEAEIRITVIEKYGKKERGHEEGNYKQDLINAKDQTIELPERQESHYHRFD